MCPRSATLPALAGARRRSPALAGARRRSPALAALVALVALANFTRP
jgi:hypothetical protein